MEEDRFLMTATEQTHRLFMRSALSDDDLGYPDSVGFVANDLPGWEDMLWRDLKEDRRPTVVVDENALETIFIPVERSTLLRLLDRLRGRVPVRVRWRHGPQAHSCDLAINLSRAGVSRLNLGSPKTAPPSTP